jgi:cytidylate kinase
VIVTIDGPAGAGKSSAARALADRLGFHFLDTGAMYRAVALAALQRQLPWDQPDLLVDLVPQLQIELLPDQVLVDGQDVTAAIRTLQVTSATHYAADNPGVRAHLVQLQRQMAEGHDVVAEGRDQGTVVFPHARCKIFLTASPEERARRRVLELEKLGETANLADILAKQTLRDLRDAQREVGPLVPAEDAILFQTDGISHEEVVERLEQLVRSRQ